MDKYKSLMLDKPIFYTEDNDILFSAPSKPRLTKQILCTGYIQPGDVAPVITVRLPVSLTPAAFVAYMREALPGIIVVDDVSELSESQFLNFQLRALRNGAVQPRPMGTRKPLTDEQFETIETEWVGREQFDCKGEW